MKLLKILELLALVVIALVALTGIEKASAANFTAGKVGAKLVETTTENPVFAFKAQQLFVQR